MGVAVSTLARYEVQCCLQHYFRSTLCCDEVEAVSGGEVEGIAGCGWTGIEGSVHFDLSQQFFLTSRTKDGHETFRVAGVKTVARQQKAAPDSIVRLVPPKVSAGC